MMMILKEMIFISLFLLGVISFILMRKHLLMMLLSLEFIVLALFLFLSYILSLFNYELYFLMFFLVFSVCEGALGISMMVSMIRTHGNDYFNSISMLQC